MCKQNVKNFKYLNRFIKIIIKFEFLLLFINKINNYFVIEFLSLIINISIFSNFLHILKS